jgi:hypothetical protein
MVSIANTAYGLNDNTLVACPASPLPSVSVSKDPTTPVPFLASSNTLSPRRSPIVQVKIRSDDDDVMKYQEIRITGVIYCDHNSHYCDTATSIEDEEQQMATINDSEFGFLRAAGVVYPCDEDDVDAMSLSSNDAMLDPSDLDLFFENDEEEALFESPKGVMDFEEAPGLSTGRKSWFGFLILPMLGFGSSSA